MWVSLPSQPSQLPQSIEQRGVNPFRFFTLMGRIVTNWREHLLNVTAVFLTISAVSSFFHFAFFSVFLKLTLATSMAILSREITDLTNLSKMSHVYRKQNGLLALHNKNLGQHIQTLQSKICDLKEEVVHFQQANAIYAEQNRSHQKLLEQFEKITKNFTQSIQSDRQVANDREEKTLKGLVKEVATLKQTTYLLHTSGQKLQEKERAHLLRFEQVFQTMVREKSRHVAHMSQAVKELKMYREDLETTKQDLALHQSQAQALKAHIQNLASTRNLLAKEVAKLQSATSQILDAVASLKGNVS